MLSKNIRKLSSIALAAILLSGCGKGQVLEKANKSSAAISIDEAKNGVYILTKDDKLYSPNTDFQNFSDTTNQADPKRVVYSVNGRKFIPKLYNDDELVYFSDKSIPALFSVESFRSTGYTIGLYGISKSSEGDYTFTKDNIIPQSDINQHDIDGNFNILKVGGRKINSSRLSKAGTVKGLKHNETVSLEALLGTYYGKLTTKADTKCYYSYDTSTISKYKTTKAGYIILSLPKKCSKYISVEGSGLIEIVNSERN